MLPFETKLSLAADAAKGMYETRLLAHSLRCLLSVGRICTQGESFTEVMRNMLAVLTKPGADLKPQNLLVSEKWVLTLNYNLLRHVLGGVAALLPSTIMTSLRSNCDCFAIISFEVTCSCSLQVV